MPAFVVASKEPECVWVPDFQGPQVQYALYPLARWALNTFPVAYLYTEVAPVDIVA